MSLINLINEYGLDIDDLFEEDTTKQIEEISHQKGWNIDEIIKEAVYCLYIKRKIY